MNSDVTSVLHVPWRQAAELLPARAADVDAGRVVELEVEGTDDGPPAQGDSQHHVAVRGGDEGWEHVTVQQPPVHVLDP